MANEPLTDADLEGLLYHGCSSGTPTPPMVRDAIVKACLELRSLRDLARNARWLADEIRTLANRLALAGDDGTAETLRSILRTTGFGV